jgi:acyl dehydratase
LGGSGFKGTGKSTNIPASPNRQPDVIIKDKTYINQALIYRLSGDPNPLHVDPNIAALAGYEKPIIHGTSLPITGLASYGTVARSVVQNLLNNDAEKLQSI